MDTGLLARQRAAARVCFEREPRTGDLDVLGPHERWLLYRTMVRDRLRSMVTVGLPRTLDEIPRDRFAAAFDAWLHEAPPRTRYIREVLPAFVQHAEPRWADDPSLPPWTTDLMRFEAARWECWYAEGPSMPAADFHFDRIPALNPALRLLRTAYPVHQRRDADAPYPPQPVNLCVHRTPDHRVDVWVLNDLAAALVQAWQREDATVTDTVRDAADHQGIPLDARLVDTLSETLAKFLRRGILLGSHPP
jgi:hypothetical protein